jgi:S-formylglutathione hydrolase FrmB
VSRRPLRTALAVALAAGCLSLGAGRAASAAPAPSAARFETLTLPTPLVDPAQPGGTMTKRRTAPIVNVRLPGGYDDDPTRRWPVLWLLHGARGGADSWRGYATTVLGDLPAILVMPEGGTFGMYMDWWNGGRRAGPAWTTFHLGEVRRVVHERYRIRSERRWHAIAGISMGGQGALRYAAVLPGYFGSVAALSAALPDMRSLDAQVGLAAVTAAAAPGVEYAAIYGAPDGPYVEGNSATALAPNFRHTRVFTSTGNGIHCPQDRVLPESLLIDTVTETGIYGQQGRFADAVEAAGARVEAQVHCGSHTFGVWDRALPEARRWGFFGQVPEHPTSWTYRTVATAGEAWGLRFRFASPPAEVVELHRSGATLRVTGHGRLELRGSGGCAMDLRLPFEGRLPAACAGT